MPPRRLLSTTLCWLFVSPQICNSDEQQSTTTVTLKVIVDDQIWTDTTTMKRLGNVNPATAVFIGFDDRQVNIVKLKNSRQAEWLDRIRKPNQKKKHRLYIRDNDYAPKTLLIRAGDEIIDPEFGKLKGLEVYSSIRFRNIRRNSPPSAFVSNYRFQFAEPQAIEIWNATHASRLSYVFVTNHNCAKITDEHGQVALSGLPLNAKIPMKVLVPWANSSKYRLQSDTLKLTSEGRFVLNVSEQPQSHTIHIVSSTDK